MEQSKSIFASKTIWGAVVALLASLGNLAGYSLTVADQAELVDLATQMVGVWDNLVIIAGSAVAIWGRVTATHRIG